MQDVNLLDDISNTNTKNTDNASIDNANIKNKSNDNLSNNIENNLNTIPTESTSNITESNESQKYLDSAADLMNNKNISEYSQSENLSKEGIVNNKETQPSSSTNFSVSNTQLNNKTDNKDLNSKSQIISSNRSIINFQEDSNKNIIGNNNFSKYLNKVKDLLLNFIFPIANISISFLLVVFYIYPNVTSYFKNSEVLENNYLTIQKLEEKLNKLQDISYLQTSFNEYYELVQKALTSSQQVPELLTIIDNIARNSGLTVNRLNYSISQNTNTQTEYSNVDVSLNVVGNLNQLLTFFELSEDALRIYNIESFRFSYSQGLELYEVSILIKSPYLQVNSQAVTDESINLDIDSLEFNNVINKLNSMTYYDPNEMTMINTVIESDTILDDDQQTLSQEETNEAIEIAPNQVIVRDLPQSE